MKVRPKVVKAVVSPSPFVVVQMSSLEELRESLWKAFEEVEVSRATVTFLEEYLFRVSNEELPAVQLAHIWQELYRSSVMLAGLKLKASSAKLEPLFDSVIKAIVPHSAARAQAIEYHALLLMLAARQADKMKMVTTS